jgi:hypothetical protein
MHGSAAPGRQGEGGDPSGQSAQPVLPRPPHMEAAGRSENGLAENGR